MERLTEKIGNTNCVKGCGSNCKYGFQHCRTEDWENCKTIDDVIDKLAEYEGLEEQGRLVILPCKVGDTLYRLVPNLYREYVEIKIAQFVINKNGIYFITDKGVSWSADKIGKTVFLTKSEAEAKLKELRGGENGSME